jgi:hypothetical protein
VKQEPVLDETYRKAGKMDSECFASTLDPFHTDLIKIVRGYLLEGTKSTMGIKAELYKLNIYSKYSIFVHPHLGPQVALRRLHGILLDSVVAGE